MLIKEWIYGNFPVYFQNVLVSLQGWGLARKRYNKDFDNYLGALMKSQWLSAEEFQHMQISRLKDLIKESILNVPYYRKSLANFSGSIEALTLEKLKDLPLLDGFTLRTNTKEFINQDRLRYGYVEGHTSGTSGAPFIWKYDWDSMRHNLSFRERQYRWAGLVENRKSARFSSRVILGEHNQAPYWRYNAAEKQWFFSIYHLNEKTLPLYYEALRSLNFSYLDGYPSTIFIIARWINKNVKDKVWCPKAVITTAEVLMDFQRLEIEKAFGCRVFNFYSSSEGAPFITQCEAGNMHLNPESGIIEFLRSDGTSAHPGEEAEMVVTSFFQRTFPLIRYRIGDTGILAENQICSCKRQMPIIERIMGREADVLYSTQSGKVGSAGLSTCFYKIPSRLKESQIEQIDTDAFVFRYVPYNSPLDEKEKKIVLEELKKRLGSSVDIKIVLVNLIAKGPGGKSRLIIGLKPTKDEQVALKGKSVFVISIDFELQWGMADKKTQERYREKVLGVRKATLATLELFNKYSIHATWAVVGFLFFNNRNELMLGLPKERPEYTNAALSNYNRLNDIGDNEESDPFHFAPSLIKTILSFSHQEIGSHTFSHYYCLEKGQNKETFKKDLEAAIEVAKRYGIHIRSFVFPKQQVNNDYLSICKEMGITAYRGDNPSGVHKIIAQNKQLIFSRLLQKTESYCNIAGYNCYSIEELQNSSPFNIPYSRYLYPYSRKFRAFESLRLKKIISELTYAAKNGRVYHLYWHCYNFGSYLEENISILRKILDCYQKMQKTYGMQSLNIGELSDKLIEINQK